jgi:hypothetical protein
LALNNINIQRDGYYYRYYYQYYYSYDDQDQGVGKKKKHLRKKRVKSHRQATPQAGNPTSPSQNLH